MAAISNAVVRYGTQFIPNETVRKVISWVLTILTILNITGVLKLEIDHAAFKLAQKIYQKIKTKIEEKFGKTWDDFKVKMRERWDGIKSKWTSKPKDGWQDEVGTIEAQDVQTATASTLDAEGVPALEETLLQSEAVFPDTPAISEDPPPVNQNQGASDLDGKCNAEGCLRDPNEPHDIASNNGESPNGSSELPRGDNPNWSNVDNSSWALPSNDPQFGTSAQAEAQAVDNYFRITDATGVTVQATEPAGFTWKGEPPTDVPKPPGLAESGVVDPNVDVNVDVPPVDVVPIGGPGINIVQGATGLLHDLNWHHQNGQGDWTTYSAVDISAPYNNEVYAPFDATVGPGTGTNANSTNDIYLVSTGSPQVTAYFDYLLSIDPAVTVGAKVHKGDVIGHVGSYAYPGQGKNNEVLFAVHPGDPNNYLTITGVPTPTPTATPAPGATPPSQPTTGPTSCGTDTQCETFLAMTLATMHVLSDFDSTKHGASNQEGLGQILPSQKYNCWQVPPGTHDFGNTFANSWNADQAWWKQDISEIGCELGVDLAASNGDVRAAFARYVKDNELPPVNGAWPGQKLPDGADFGPAVTTSDSKLAKMPTADLLTYFTSVYFDLDVHPDKFYQVDPLDPNLRVFGPDGGYNGTYPTGHLPGNLSQPDSATLALIAAAAGKYNVSLPFFLAIVNNESSFHAIACSKDPSGRLLAFGMFQMLPGTFTSHAKAIGLPSTTWTNVMPDTNTCPNGGEPAAMNDPSVEVLPAAHMLNQLGATANASDNQLFLSAYHYNAGPNAPLGYADATAYANTAVVNTRAYAAWLNSGATGQSGQGHFSWPIGSAANISQGFGCTQYTGEPRNASCPPLSDGYGHYHTGLDIALGCANNGPSSFIALGPEVKAAGGGNARALTEFPGYGYYIDIDHGNGWETIYGHMHDTIQSGPVQAGQVIGHEGSTGSSTGCHVHFEVRHNGVPVDPGPMLNPPVNA